MMKKIKPVSPSNAVLLPPARAILLTGLVVAVAHTSPAQLFENLESFHQRTKVGDPESKVPYEGPKDIASADFNADGYSDIAISNTDGSITLLMGNADGFDEAIHLRPGGGTLRGLIAADLNGDEQPDIATAAPGSSKVFIYYNNGGTFGEADELTTWRGARDLIDGDFDGDGIRDLMIGGPLSQSIPAHLKYYRGIGNGNFEFTSNLNLDERFYSGKQLYYSNRQSRPVHAMKTIRSRDNLRDNLVFTFPDSMETLIIGTEELTFSGGKDYFDPALQEAPNDAIVLISEFMANNTNTLADEDGDFSDWIELYNDSNESINLEGWIITDGKFHGWVLPKIILEPGKFRILFASGKDRRDPNGELHTGFKLSSGGEYLAIAKHDGTIVHEYEAIQLDPTSLLRKYPEHTSDVSYGLAHDGTEGYFTFPSPGWENNANYVSWWRFKKRIESETKIYSYVKNWADVSYHIEPKTPKSGDPITIKISFSPMEAAGIPHRYHDLFFDHLNPISVEYRSDETNWRNTEMTYSDGSYALHLELDSWNWVRFRFVAKGTYVDLDGKEKNEAYSIGKVTILSSEPAPISGSSLNVLGTIPNLGGSRSISIGTLTTKADSDSLDLVTLNRDKGTVDIRKGNNGHKYFNHQVYQSISVAGGPRAAEIFDFNGDGWNDILVVLRNFNRAIVLKNNEGVFEISSEIHTGVSPREIAKGDFNNDGVTQFAVINRWSHDLSILKLETESTKFSKLDMIYTTDGEVASLSLADYNKDGRDDVFQLHRASEEISIRIAGPDGRLNPPIYVPVAKDQQPSAPATRDVNNDGFMDLIVANLGRGVAGSISVRLGDGAGDFLPEIVMTTPPDLDNRGLFAVEVADFDNDGNLDLVAGHFDCRVTFFRGIGDGTFEYTRTHPFTYESRVMVAGDFNQDGNIDLAGAGYAGDVVIFKNEGDLLTTTDVIRIDYDSSVRGKFGTRDIRIFDFDGNSDPDLLVGSGTGVMIYRGIEDIRFEFVGTVRLGSDTDGDSPPISSLTIGDFDNDGKNDFAAACRILSCLSIMVHDEATDRYVPAVTVDVPSADFLASGDIDGDGHADLVGSGEVLWVALSSKTSEEIPDEPEPDGRETLDQVVINEILTRNTKLEIEQDNNKKSDFVELFNGTDTPASLSNWKLDVVDTNEFGTVTNKTFTLPEINLEPGGHLLLFFSITERSERHTGFKLTKHLESMTLSNASGDVIDQIRIPPQQKDISFGRYLDASPSFVFDCIPSPGRPNQDNGVVEPDIDIQGLDLDSIKPGQEIPFTAEGQDDVGIISLTLLYRELDRADAETQRVVLYDDGMHNDGGMLDGLFAGVLPPIAKGQGIQYYFEAVDLSGATLQIPDNPLFANPGEEITIYSLSIPEETAPLQISEVVADNKNGLTDEGGGTPDYIEIRNTSNQSISLDGFQLGRSLTEDPEELFTFPEGTVLEPGQHIVVYADENTLQGQLHAPFKIDQEGDRIVLIGTSENGGKTFVDGIDTVPLGQDEALIRIPGNDAVWFIGQPSPFADDFQGTSPILEIGYDRADQEHLIYLFPTEADTTYIPEYSDTLKPDSWVPLDPIEGNGGIQSVCRPVGNNNGFVRIQMK